MAEDIKFIIALLVCLALPAVAAWCFPDAVPEFKLWSRDEHFDFFVKERQSDRNPDVIFFGSSGTMNNVHTPLLNQFSREEGKNRSHTNFGVNWFGHGMNAAMLDLWLEKKKPGLVVLEVPVLYRFYLHPYFDKLATPNQLLRLVGTTPRKGIGPMLAYGPRLCYQSFASLRGDVIERRGFNREEEAGYVRIDLSEALMRQHAEIFTRELAKGPIDLPRPNWLKSIYYDLNYGHQLAFIRQMVERCQRQGIRIVLMVIPRLRLNHPDPRLLEYYRSMADVLIPPADLIQKPEYWRDQSHLNIKGAKALAPWIYRVIKDR